MTYKEIAELCGPDVKDGQVGAAIRLLDGAGVTRALSGDATASVTLDRPGAEVLAAGARGNAAARAGGPGLGRRPGDARPVPRRHLSPGQGRRPGRGPVPPGPRLAGPGGAHRVRAAVPRPRRPETGRPAAALRRGAHRLGPPGHAPRPGRGETRRHRVLHAHRRLPPAVHPQVLRREEQPGVRHVRQVQHASGTGPPRAGCDWRLVCPCSLWRRTRPHVQTATTERRPATSRPRPRAGNHRRRPGVRPPPAVPAGRHAHRPGGHRVEGQGPLGLAARQEPRLRPHPRRPGEGQRRSSTASGAKDT